MLSKKYRSRMFNSLSNIVLINYTNWEVTRIADVRKFCGVNNIKNVPYIGNVRADVLQEFTKDVSERTSQNKK